MLDGLAAEPQLVRLFSAGKEVFEDVETPTDRLGPFFNAASCAECHAHPRATSSAPPPVGAPSPVPLSPRRSRDGPARLDSRAPGGRRCGRLASCTAWARPSEPPWSPSCARSDSVLVRCRTAVSARERRG